MHTPYSYRLLGLDLESTHPLPALAPLAGPRGEGLEIFLQSAPPGEGRQARGWHPYASSGTLGEDGEPVLRVWRRRDGGLYRFLYCDGTEFFVQGDGRRLWGRWSAASTLEDTAVYLLGPLLGFVLRLRGTVPLHASAVVVDSRVIALTGPPGAGKSTTAAAFAQRGFAVASDDITTLREADGGLWVEPDCPYLRLWPDAAQLLGGAAGELPPLTPNWDKRRLDVAPPAPGPAVPRRLAAVYLLDGEAAPGGGPVVEPLAGSEALMTLVASSYVNHLLDAEMRATELDLLARWLGRLPIRRLRRPAGGADPGILCDVLVDDFRRAARPS